MVAEFGGFLLKTNALALAIGVIIGSALGTVVTSLVNDIIMPPIDAVLGGVDFSQLKVVIKSAAPGADPATEVAIR
jgi:large conductance mechanosensitive channel